MLKLHLLMMLMLQQVKMYQPRKLIHLQVVLQLKLVHQLILPLLKILHLLHLKVLFQSVHVHASDRNVHVLVKLDNLT
ncbi:hypothetical protein KC19_2G062500 [Ceratodon purpureus]|uniref:Uncharacterized protein n=1 Tax=Ceratodon purpureus TaxID=3225 RepID=A0A8T0ITK3_CERPU|nr:hypothetical protein KC19_2G062500 [Ceratodon purpureus]